MTAYRMQNCKIWMVGRPGIEARCDRPCGHSTEYEALVMRYGNTSLVPRPSPSFPLLAVRLSILNVTGIWARGTGNEAMRIQCWSKGSKHLQLDKLHDCVALFPDPTQAVCHYFCLHLGRVWERLPFLTVCGDVLCWRCSDRLACLIYCRPSLSPARHSSSWMRSYRITEVSPGWWWEGEGRRKVASQLMVTLSHPHHPTHTPSPSPHTSHTHTHLLMSLLACCV